MKTRSQSVARSHFRIVKGRTDSCAFILTPDSWLLTPLFQSSIVNS